MTFAEAVTEMWLIHINFSADIEYFSLTDTYIEIPIDNEKTTTDKTTIPNVLEELKKDIETTKFRIEARNYDSITGLIHALNAGIHKAAPYARNHVCFKWSKDIGRVEWECLFHFVKLDMSITLGKLLGFTKSNVISTIGKDSSNLFAPDPPNLSFSLSTLWVYTDIIEPVVVGDTMANLLRIVPVKGGGGGEGGEGWDSKTVIRIYERPHYVNLATNRFQIVEIMLNTTYGLAPIFFVEPVLVKLHFRKKKVLHLQ